jgi:cobalt/nickel transport protein
MTESETRGWWPKALVVLLVLVALAPLFGWAAGTVGYAEPLEHAAETTGATHHARSVHDGLLPDYGVPGLGPASGTLASALAGTALTLLVATAIGRGLADDTDSNTSDGTDGSS